MAAEREEARKRAQQQEQMQIDLEASRRTLRTVPLGQDRCGRLYWLLAPLGHALVIEACQDAAAVGGAEPSAGWQLVLGGEDVTALLAWLDDRGIRERSLKRAIEGVADGLAATAAAHADWLAGRAARVAASGAVATVHEGDGVDDTSTGTAHQLTVRWCVSVGCRMSGAHSLSCPCLVSKFDPLSLTHPQRGS